MSNQHRTVAFQQARVGTQQLDEAPHLPQPQHSLHLAGQQDLADLESGSFGSGAGEQVHPSALHHSQQSYLLSTSHEATTPSSQLQQVEGGYTSQVARPHAHGSSTYAGCALGELPPPPLPVASAASSPVASSATTTSIGQPLRNYVFLDTAQQGAQLRALDESLASKGSASADAPAGAVLAGAQAAASAPPSLNPPVFHYAQPMEVNHLLTFGDEPAAVEPPQAHPGQYRLHSGQGGAYVGVGPAAQLQARDSQPGAATPGLVHLSKVDERQAGQIFVLVHAGANR